MAARAKFELHPEPFYTTSGGAFGAAGLDKNVPARGSAMDLTLRFKDDPALYAKAQGQYLRGRYIVSVGPDRTHNMGVYNVSNGLKSSGDLITVLP